VNANDNPDMRYIPDPRKIKVTISNYAQIYTAMIRLGLKPEQIGHWVNVSNEAHYGPRGSDRTDRAADTGSDRRDIGRDANGDVRRDTHRPDLNRDRVSDRVRVTRVQPVDRVHRPVRGGRD
jgi:hypothetical protein